MAKFVEHSQEQRGKPRHSVHMLGQLGGSDGYFDGIILNLSDDGFSAQLRQALEVGSWVDLNCAGYTGVGATVVWRKGHDHGFKFAQARPIRPAPAADGARTVIWVDFNAWSVVDGP